jgi:hypothetical protein
MHPLTCDPSAPKIGVLSRSRPFLETICDALELEGFAGVPLEAFPPEEKLSGEISLLLVDPSLPSEAAFSLHDASQAHNIPVLKPELPLSLNELLQSIKTRLGPAPSEFFVLNASFRFLPSERCIHDTETELRLALTEKESALLQALLTNGNATREKLLQSVWGYDAAIETHTFETHLYRLKNKLRPLLPEFDAVADEKGQYKVTGI